MASQYTAAINSLTEAERTRIIIGYLHHNDPKNIDWTDAAVHAGAKNKNSFQTAFSATMKKLNTMVEQKESGSAADNGHSEADDSGAVKAAPKKRKRALAGASAEEGNDGVADQAPKKRNRSKKDVKKAETEAKKAYVEAFVDDTIARYINPEHEGNGN